MSMQIIYNYEMDVFFPADINSMKLFIVFHFFKSLFAMTFTQKTSHHFN